MVEETQVQTIDPSEGTKKKSPRDYRRELEEQHMNHGFLTRYQHMGEDKFISPTSARFFIVEEGYEGVRERVGKVNGWPFLWNQFSSFNPGGAFWTALAGATAGYFAGSAVGTKTAIASSVVGGLSGLLLGGGGQRIKPGIRFVVGLRNAWGRVAFVNMQLRTDDLPPQEVVTKDGIVLSGVDYVYNWKVIDPVKALTKSRDYKQTSKEIAIARGREVIGKSGLEDLDDIKDTERNLMYKDKDTKLDFPELKEIGVDIESLYLRNWRLPVALEASLAQGVIAKKEAEGELALAKTRVEIAEQHRLEAEKYEQNMEGARLVIARDVLDEMAKKEKVTLIGAPVDRIMEMLGKLTDKLK